MKHYISTVFFDLIYLICSGNSCLKTFDNSITRDGEPTTNSYLVMSRLKYEEMQGVWHYKITQACNFHKKKSQT